MRAESIAIDSTNFMLERRSGIKRYLAGLIPALARAAPDIRFTAWMGFLRPAHRDGFPAWSEPNLRTLALRLPRRLFEGAWARGRLAAESIAPGAGVFHSFWYHLPPARRARRILTVFDFREVALARLYPGESDRVRRLFERSLREADCIVASSHATAADLRAHFDLEGRAIEVVHGAVEGSFQPQPAEAVSSMRERLDIHGPYVLAVGSGDPRKNIPFLIRSFLRYRERAKDDLRLVIAGARHPDDDAALAEANRGQRGSVHAAGDVSDRDWKCLLTGAEAFIYPSLYEGLGLPPLEAMACGSPAICSDLPAVKEWAGSAARYFDPASEESLAAALTELRGASGLAERLRLAGRLQAAVFTWDRIARDYLRIYRRVLEG